MQDLHHAYIEESADLMGFYERPLSRLFEELPTPQPLDESLADAIERYNQCLGKAITLNREAAFVVTGQQPAVFAGPLYTVYKAITAIKLAARFEEQTGRPCVPLFWVGTEDHDFEEARTVHLLSKEDRPVELTYTPSTSVRGFPLYRVPLEQMALGLVEDAAAQARGSELSDGIRDFLRESALASGSLADWSARLLQRLFLDTPLVLFAPHAPEARRLAQDILRREVAEPLETTRLLNEAGRALEQAGYPRAIAKAPHECAFFVEMGDRRRKVLFEEGRFRMPEENMSFTPGELSHLLEGAPERFSANVALRCVVQQKLFRPLAYVAGPSELSYWGQFKSVFARHGMTMPAVYPRAHGTLTTIKTNKLLRRYGFAISDLSRPVEDLLEQALRHVHQSPARAIADEHRGRITESVERLKEELARHSKTASQMTGRIQQKVETGLGRVERVILTEDEQQTQTVRQHVERLCDMVYPLKKPQERVYSPFSFVFEYGWGLIPRLVQALDIESFEMNEVEL